MNRRSFLTRALTASAGAAVAPLPGFTAVQEKHDVRNLRITDLKTFLVDAGNDENYVYVKIYTNQGITGLGEGTLSGKCLTVATAIGELKRYLVGKDPTEIERHWQEIFRGPRYRGRSCADVGPERVLSLYFTVTSVIAGGLAGLFLLAFLSPRANKQGAYVGIAACLLFTAYATFTSGKDRMLDLGAYNFAWNNVLIGVIGHIVLLVVGYLASFAFAKSTPLSREMTLWGWRDRQAAEATAPKG